MLKMILSVIVMVLVTYIPRAIPMIFYRKIRSNFILSFLNYIPYTVLAVMTVPAIFDSTGNNVASVVGFMVAAILAYFDFKLVTVAVISVLAAFLCLCIF